LIIWIAFYTRQESFRNHLEFYWKSRVFIEKDERMQSLADSSGTPHVRTIRTLDGSIATSIVRLHRTDLLTRKTKHGRTCVMRNRARRLLLLRGGRRLLRRLASLLLALRALRLLRTTLLTHRALRLLRAAFLALRARLLRTILLLVLLAGRLDTSLKRASLVCLEVLSQILSPRIQLGRARFGTRRRSGTRTRFRLGRATLFRITEAAITLSLTIRIELSASAAFSLVTMRFAARLIRARLTLLPIFANQTTHRSTLSGGGGTTNDSHFYR